MQQKLFSCIKIKDSAQKERGNTSRGWEYWKMAMKCTAWIIVVLVTLMALAPPRYVCPRVLRPPSKISGISCHDAETPDDIARPAAGLVSIALGQENLRKSFEQTLTSESSGKGPGH